MGAAPASASPGAAVYGGRVLKEAPPSFRKGAFIGVYSCWCCPPPPRQQPQNRPLGICPRRHRRWLVHPALWPLTVLTWASPGLPAPLEGVAWADPGSTSAGSLRGGAVVSARGPCHGQDSTDDDCDRPIGQRLDDLPGLEACESLRGGAAQGQDLVSWLQTVPGATHCNS